MKNYNETNNNEIINEVNSIMNTVSEEKLNESLLTEQSKSVDKSMGLFD